MKTEVLLDTLAYGISSIVTVNAKDFDAIDEITIRTLML
jgi:hypothetical protein